MASNEREDAADELTLQTDRKKEKGLGAVHKLRVVLITSRCASLPLTLVSPDTALPVLNSQVGNRINSSQSHSKEGGN